MNIVINLAGWWFHTYFFICPFHIWDVNLPIDELHHFSRCFFNQPDPTSNIWKILGEHGDKLGL